MAGERTKYGRIALMGFAGAAIGVVNVLPHGGEQDSSTVHTMSWVFLILALVGGLIGLAKWMQADPD